jgi:hypothetical protein
MIVFLDFEASSLSDDSYPIEVGWVFEDGLSETHLIRPAAAWTDWDEAAEAIHGISRERLAAEGEPHEAVARRILEALSEHEVFVTAPSWDGKWLSVLLRAAGLPRHAMRFKDSQEALLRAADEGLGPAIRPAEREQLIPALILEARGRLAAEPVLHEALADAQQERRLWLEIRRLAELKAASLASRS